MKRPLQQLIDEFDGCRFPGVDGTDLVGVCEVVHTFIANGVPISLRVHLPDSELVVPVSKTGCVSGVDVEDIDNEVASMMPRSGFARSTELSLPTHGVYGIRHD